jgi:4-hydroxy-2-oxoheptanedioate aldolase
VANVDEIVAVDGVDAIYIGPWDLSLTLGCPPDPADPALSAALRTVWSAAARAGKPVGTHAADGATARDYRAAGCRLLTVATDSGVLGRSVSIEIGAALDSGR